MSLIGEIVVLEGNEDLNEKCVLKMESSLFDLDVKYLKSKEVK